MTEVQRSPINLGNIVYRGEEWVPLSAFREAMDGWKAANERHRAAGQAELLPEEPSEAVIRAVDKACHERWPNARKMAVAMYGVIREAALAPLSQSKGEGL